MRIPAMIFALAGLVVACAANDKTLKELFAPDFGAATETQLQDGMWRLGHGVKDLDDVFNEPNITDDARHAAIVETLDLMYDAAASVTKPGQKQGHTNVAMNIEKLKADIDAARTSAAAKDYTLAKSLPTSCLACHKSAPGGAQAPAR